jgi:CubicO group peptidase (beta-lactamase class C family)
MKKFKITLVALLAILSIIVIAYSEQIKRVYQTITLFDEDVILNNFSNMSSIFRTVEIKPSTTPSIFERHEHSLPASFTYKGEDISIKDFINKTSTTSLLVVKGNTITFEEYYQGTKDTDSRISWSVAKSLLSALFGVAVEEGYIKSIEEPVTKYVPELLNSGYDGVRIKDVLQMSSGVAFNEDYLDFYSDINRFGRALALGSSIDDFSASLVNKSPPGTYLKYVSINTHVIGMVIRAATGRTIVDYFNEKIWSKIQPESSLFYIVDNQNEPMVLAGMNLRTRDFARFGQLYMNKGLWNSEQVIPSDWVNKSVTPDAPHLTPGKRDSSDIVFGYGYQWWIPENADEEFVAWGIYDQYIYVNQKLGVVIVKNSAHLGFADNNYESRTKTIEFFRNIANSITEL